ncbi:MAG: DDE transposase, partial [Bacteroidetes bacterium CG_4_10_14_3_um_filter_31_20]
YTCPQGNTLKTNGTWYNKSQGKNRNDTKIQHFKTNECKNCPVITLCTKSKYGRVLERSEYAEYIEQNRKN